MAPHALLLLLLAAASAQTIPSKPNVLFILVDDLGHAELGYHSPPAPTAHPHPQCNHCDPLTPFPTPCAFTFPRSYHRPPGYHEVQTPSIDALVAEGINL